MARGNSENPVIGIRKLRSKVSELEKQIENLNDKLEHMQNLEKIHMLRVKNGDEVSDDFIIKGSYYHDLSPEKAFEIYNQKDKDFILLDVSADEFQPIADFPEATKIPLEEIVYRTHELPNKATRILVISENGLRSIRACHLLHQLGYYNINNISGGYKYWPGFHNLQHIKPAKVSA